MMRAFALVVLLGACTRAGSSHEAPSPSSAPTPVESVAPAQPAVAPAPPAVTPAPPVTTPSPPPAPVATAAVTVQMTAATLADDCGGSAPWTAPTPVPAAKPVIKAEATKEKRKADEAYDPSDAPKGAAFRRRCEQTSMQLQVAATGGSGPTKLAVKSVELFDDGGRSLGKLAASSPTQWVAAKSLYEAWDERITPGQTLQVSYVLAQPVWASAANRFNKTYTLKAVVTVGGADQPLSKDVRISAPTILPPNVKT